jgi:hypothetical protein
MGTEGATFYKAAPVERVAKGKNVASVCLATMVMAMFRVLVVQGIICAMGMFLFPARMMVVSMFAMDVFMAVMPLSVVDVFGSRWAGRYRRMRCGWSWWRCLCHDY